MVQLLRTAGLALLLATGLSSQGVAQTKITAGLFLPENMKNFEHVNGMYKFFKQEVEAKSGGKLEVELIWGGSLGKPTERLSQVRRGIIQMSDASEGDYSTIYPDIQVVSIPYLFPDEQTAWKVLDGPFGQAMAEDIRAKTGIRIFGYWEAGGFRHYSANKPIPDPEAMKGMKMRVMAPVFGIPVQAMGGAAVPISFGELYTSLKTGVVDGQDNAANVFALMKFYEVQKYLMLDGHVYSFAPLGMNDAFFQGLPADLQKVVTEAAQAAIAFNRKTSRATEQEAIDLARANGVTVIPISAETKKEFAAQSQGPVLEWLKDKVSTPDLIDRLMAAVKDASM